MAKTKLTQSFLAKAKPGEKRIRHWDTEVPGFFAAVAPTGRITFYLRYRHEGVPKDFKIGVYGSLTAEQARKLAKQAAGDAARDVDLQAERRRKRLARQRQRQATLCAFLNEVYGPHLLTETKNGEAALARIAACFGKWFSMPMTEITEFRVMRWRRDEIQRGLANSSINRSVTYLQACLNQAERLGVIQRNPIRGLRRLKEDRLGRAPFLSAAQEDVLRAALSARDRSRLLARQRANKWRSERGLPLLQETPFGGFTDHMTPLVLIAMNTGLRRGELFHLKWEHLDADCQTATVVASNAKSRSTRHVALNSEARSVLLRWQRQVGDSPFVFPSPKTGRPLTDIKHAWTSILKDAGISGFRFHDLRHHFASRLVSEGVPLNTVRDLLGHSELNMTLRYAHLAPSHRAEAVAVLDRARS